MRYLILYINIFLLACLSIVSCSDIESIEADYEKAIELTVSCTNQNITRSTAPGEDALNENLISTLHYFLYKSGATDQNAVLVGKINIAQGTQKSAVVRIPMNEQELNNDVFPNPYNTCEVYLIANLPDGILPNDLKTLTDTRLATLKEKVIETNFKDNMPQLSFIMDGQAQATIVSRKKTVAAKGTIELERLAAKLTTRISVADSFTDTDGKVWTPQLEGMKIHLDNCVSNTTIGATLGDNHFDYEQRVYMGTKTETIDDKNVLYHVYAPFYSYPCQWEFDSDEALVVYVKLPWGCTENGSTQYKDCYYKVYPNTMQLDRNSWYNLDMHIDVFGSFKETEDPVEIENFKYKVIDWKNGFPEWDAGLDINTELLSAHYLVVEQNHYVVNNKNTFEIPFITSHPCKIKDLKVKRMDFGTTENPTASPKDITSQATGWLTLVGNKIMLNHTLNNNFESTTNTNYDFTPYEFEFTLCHQTNETNFKEKITITQKPAISITAHLNSYREAYLAGKLPTDNNGTNGYQYVNGYPAGTNNKYDNEYGGAYGLYINSQSNTNKNPYMYTIEVTVLPKDSKYILGDPRWDEPATKDDNQMDLDFNGYDKAPGIESEGLATRPNRTLKNYYGTKTDASVENMIAPKFRIASSHGVTQPVSHTNAYNRAATYQEDGYPAGRWRVPTRAEVKFIIKLSRDGHIPTLFNTGSAYWCANGTVTPNNNSGISETVGTNGTNSVRCVYDDWYWENSLYPRMQSLGNHPSKYNRFTWGDEI